ncbi:MAG: integration host factor subunit beta [Syntrophobacterales bacterium]|nr:MAG: integration host factor subunit beta [Syntrophobacterales bacterium]
MNKSELIDALSKKEGLTEKQAADMVGLIFKGFSNQLKNGGRIEIRGFGSFVVRDYDSYTGRNPKTGGTIHVDPKKLPFFKVGKELKERVNAGK